MKKTILCLVFAFIAVSILPAYAQKKITAKGMATIQKEFVDIARSKALDEAQRNAVEQVAGVMITSTTNVENFQVKMDSILSESSGFIDKYDIISEKRSGNLYEVVIKATVSEGKLRDKMAAIKLIMARKSNPRVMLIFKDSESKDAVAEGAMAKYLKDHNFKLVDARALKKNRDYERLQEAEDKKAISSIAHRYGAEVIIFGTVEAISKSSTIYNVEMNKNSVVVTGKVVNGDTGEIVTTESETESDNKGKGEFKVLTEKTSTKLIAKLVDDVLESWSKELANTATIKLVVSGLNSYAALQKFKSVIGEEIKGFKGMNQRHYSKGKAEFDLEIEGDTQAVAHDVSQITIGKRSIKIEEISQNRIEAVLLP
ncbi:MAG: hypothetical protein CVU71_09540 [Deltaproteobacteria bacterium HGW-Deltaproteobacteria-6]|jgi:hypothetical protein|nr:MAG: hypothetical protein CVU71_09540 [Deltaproteobacteria bacterium HGW-Deltaproteobacteria-6]